MKKLLSLLLVAAFMFTLSSAYAEEKVKLTIYAQYADEDTKVPYDYAVEKLAEAYPNVELELPRQGTVPRRRLFQRRQGRFVSSENTHAGQPTQTHQWKSGGFRRK